MASGGFGWTYEAWHTQLDARIALKEFFLSPSSLGQDVSRLTISFLSKGG